MMELFITRARYTDLFEASSSELALVKGARRGTCIEVSHCEGFCSFEAHIV